jgi:hypothetical protein
MMLCPLQIIGGGSNDKSTRNTRQRRVGLHAKIAFRKSLQKFKLVDNPKPEVCGKCDRRVF